MLVKWVPDVQRPYVICGNSIYYEVYTDVFVYNEGKTGYTILQSYCKNIFMFP